MAGRAGKGEMAAVHLGGQQFHLAGYGGMVSLAQTAMYGVAGFTTADVGRRASLSNGALFTKYQPIWDPRITWANGAVRKRDAVLEPLLLLISGAQLAELGDREDLFDDFCSPWSVWRASRRSPPRR